MVKNAIENVFCISIIIPVLSHQGVERLNFVKKTKNVSFWQFWAFEIYRIPKNSPASKLKLWQNPDIESIWDFIAFYEYIGSVDLKTGCCQSPTLGELFL
jgi:hypothetical protein